jgi:tetratricopeptide (TPR) repeat protein
MSPRSGRDKRRTRDRASDSTRRSLALLIAVVLVAWVAGWKYRSYRQEASFLAFVPTPELDGTEPQVAEKTRALIADLRAHPTSAAAWGKLAMTLDAHNFRPEAILSYQKAAALDDRDFRWPYLCGIALKEMGSSDAVMWYQRARTLRADFAPLHVRLAQAFVDEGRWTEARAAFQEALRVDHSFPPAYMGLGRLALLDGHLEESRTYLRQSLTLAPDLRDAKALLSEVERRTGEASQSHRSLRRMVRLPKRGRLRDAITTARDAEGVSSSWDESRGHVYMSREQFPQAIEEFQKALAIRPTADLHNNIAACLYNLGRTDAALEHLHRALAMEPEHPEANCNLGILEMNAGHRDQAIASFRKAVERGSENPIVRQSLAWLLATRFNSSHDDAREAVTLISTVADGEEDDNPDTLRIWAAAYARAGLFPEARAAAAKGLQRAELLHVTDLADGLRRNLASYEKNQPVSQ